MFYLIGYGRDGDIVWGIYVVLSVCDCLIIV